MVREAVREDLDELLKLYLYLHEREVPEQTEALRSTWDAILAMVITGVKAAQRRARTVQKRLHNLKIVIK